jgi:hypothetical protein
VIFPFAAKRGAGTRGWSEMIEFTKPPCLEWHHTLPFAVARLPADYARSLAQIALDNEEKIVSLPISKGWEDQAPANPTTARYKSYNALLLSTQCLPLFFALRATARVLMGAAGIKPSYSAVQAWCNIHRTGQRLVRHFHESPMIGSFIAFGEGGTTRYGRSVGADDQDHVIDNADGQILVTLGGRHYHEVSAWTNEAHPRVSFAFDFMLFTQLQDKNAYRLGGSAIPLDGPDFGGAAR